MPIANTCSIGYPHDSRADNAAYRHDRRADNAAYRHDRRADSLSQYTRDAEVDKSLSVMTTVFMKSAGLSLKTSKISFCQNMKSLLVKRQTENTTPGGVCHAKNCSPALKKDFAQTVTMIYCHFMCLFSYCLTNKKQDMSQQDYD